MLSLITLTRCAIHFARASQEGWSFAAVPDQYGYLWLRAIKHAGHDPMGDDEGWRTVLTIRITHVQSDEQLVQFLEELV